MNWTEIKVNSVKIIHHSTSSSIEMLITTDEEIEQGKVEKVTQIIWFDYYTFSDLKKAVNQTDLPQTS